MQKPRALTRSSSSSSSTLPLIRSACLSLSRDASRSRQQGDDVVHPLPPLPRERGWSSGSRHSPLTLLLSSGCAFPALSLSHSRGLVSLCPRIVICRTVRLSIADPGCKVLDGGLACSSCARVERSASHFQADAIPSSGIPLSLSLSASLVRRKAWIQSRSLTHRMSTGA